MSPHVRQGSSLPSIRHQPDPNRIVRHRIRLFLQHYAHHKPHPETEFAFSPIRARMNLLAIVGHLAQLENCQFDHAPTSQQSHRRYSITYSRRDIHRWASLGLPVPRREEME